MDDRKFGAEIAEVPDEVRVRLTGDLNGRADETLADAYRQVAAGAGQVAQHEGEDAAVPVVAQLLLGIDSAEHLDVARLAVRGRDGDGELLPRLQPS